jgi:threonine synthase
MNVGHPSNLARLVAIYGGHMDETGKIHKQPNLAAMRRDIFSTSVSDARTIAGVREFWDHFQLLLEPHGSVAWQGFCDWNAVEPLGNSPAVIIETANPAKFPDEIEKVVGWPPDVPTNMTASLQLPEDFDRLGADYATFKNYLLEKHGSKTAAPGAS